MTLRNKVGRYSRNTDVVVWDGEKIEFIGKPIDFHRGVYLLQGVTGETYAAHYRKCLSLHVFNRYARQDSKYENAVLAWQGSEQLLI
jgi:hypothetical protein